MSTLIIKSSHHWIHLPATDEIRPQWVNLNAVRKVNYTTSPVRVILHYSAHEKANFVGLQAIAIIDALEKLGGNDDDHE